MASGSASDRKKLQDATCRVALAAYLHDIGKLAQRGKIFDKAPEREIHLQLYCPHHSSGERDPGYFTHQHAADTALALDVLEPHMPPLKGTDSAPFADAAGTDGGVDSLINAAAAHHKPESFLQWIIASADRIASAFEREEWPRYNQQKDRDDFRRARLLVRFEEYGGPAAPGPRIGEEGDFRYRYPLKPLSPDALMPQERQDLSEDEAVAQYRALWDLLVGKEDQKSGIGLIPKSHRSCWPLWLDHFDRLWLTVTHAIPSATAFGTRPDVSLYDHSRTTAAIAAALWRYHHELGHEPEEVKAYQQKRVDWDENKFLLVQGDFSGIQAFVFGGAAQTQKKAARLLRGRSAMVSLLTELAALALLDELALPPTSQVINAAGKFLIVAPNTPKARDAFGRVRSRLDKWFLDNSFGLFGMALAASEASPNGLVNDFASVLERLRSELESAKRQMFALASAQPPDAIRAADFAHGPCLFDGRLPASEGCEVDGEAAHPLSRDAVELGKALADPRKSRLFVFESPAKDISGCLQFDFFGYRVLLTADQEASGNFGQQANEGRLRRAWDFSLADKDGSAIAWSGYGRRSIAAHVPLARHDLSADPRFAGIEPVERGKLLTFEHLARVDRLIAADDSVRGIEAIAILKGDIDDLGSLFARQMGNHPSFAKWAELSRRIDGFFTIWVPHRLAAKFPDIYTVFAGGDDFLFIGPWRTLRRFAVRLRDDFSRYVAGNEHIHFSAAYAISKPGFPVRQLAAAAEDGLENAKSRAEKNAFSLHGTVIAWDDWAQIEGMIAQIEKHLGDPLQSRVDEQELSTAFIYGLLELSRMAQSLTSKTQGRVDPRNALWRSRLFYQTRRLVERRHGRARSDQERAIQERELARMIEDFGERGIGQKPEAFRIALYDQIYARRKA